MGLPGEIADNEQVQMRGFNPDVSGCEQIPFQGSTRNGDGCILTLVWEARIRCSPVYMKGGLLKRIALEALGNGGGWIRN